MTVWLQSADAARATPIDDYRAALAEVVATLQATGSRVAIVFSESDGSDLSAAAAAAVAGERRVEAVVVADVSSRAHIAQQLGLGG